MSRSNAMSALGRMGWGTHMLAYPTLLGAYIFGYKPYKAAEEEAEKARVMEDMAKAKTVDPDLFNPFTAIPFHNNPELKYVFAETNMRKFINEHHISPTSYAWKNYHDSYDHGSKKTYKYNWSSI